MNKVEVIKFMENVQDYSSRILDFSLFSELANQPAALHELASLMRYETFKSREMIIDERQTDDRMFFLLSGQVVINKVDEKGQIVVISKMDAQTHPFFGESILLGKMKKIANVTAHTQCECLTLSSANFETFMKSYPSVAVWIFRNIASVLFDRLSKADRDVFIATLMLQK